MWVLSSGLAQDHGPTLVPSATEAAPLMPTPGPRASWTRSLRRAVVVAATLAAGGAQAVDCNRLRTAIQAADQPGPEGGAWTSGAQRQRAEIARTQHYADQLGCGRGGPLGADRPAECDEVADRLQRMQDNLATMEEQVRSGADDGRRRAALLARYNSACAGQGGGLLEDFATRLGEALFPDQGRSPANPPPEPADPNLSTVPLDGDIMEDPGTGHRNLGQAICVRTCDGGYFPLTPRATEGQLSGLEQLCQASCPNTEAKLYTLPADGNLAGATAADGTGYTALPAAFQFEKSFAPACTCKPPTKSWAEALAEAEKLLDTPDRHDITVTAALSDQMAKPGSAPPSKGKPAKGGKPGKASDALVSAPSMDLGTARDAQKALQAPTASDATTGIGGPVTAARVVREGEGATVAMPGPNGVSKRVRLIEP